MAAHEATADQLQLLKQHAIREGRGRPRTAPDELRSANYRDQSGQYQLSDGLKLWHERIVDFLLLRPDAKIVDIAREFGMTPQWIGELIKTDAFKEYYHREMAAHRERVSNAIIDKTQKMTLDTIDKLQSRVEKMGDQIPTSDLKDVAKLGLSALGFGNSNVRINVNNSQQTLSVIAVPEDVITAAREKAHALREHNTRRISQTATVDEYGHVTASLELQEEEEIEDAEIVHDDG